MTKYWEERPIYTRAVDLLRVINLTKTQENQAQDKVLGWFSGIHKMIERMLRKSLEFLENAADKPFKLADKIMYGSDWHMVSMVNDIEAYFGQIKDIFEKQKMQPFADKFYFKNALRYVDLEAYIKRAENVFSQDYIARLKEIRTNLM
ncbi:hypothetical protein [Idiomarina sp. ST10R2A5]|uniref:hypothetical protein n=1 Tax=Idiomarina sp. ST10R2A5 TaxID=3418368 RepID=UPI003EC8DE50